jgi:hypothetical protein
MTERLRGEPIASPIKVPRQLFHLDEQLPLVLHVAFWIQIAEAVYSAVNFTIRLIGFDRATFLAHARAVAEQKHERIFADSYVIQVFVVTNVLFAIVILLEVVVAFLVRRGFNWARILLTISLGLGFVSLITSPPTDPLTYVITAVDALLLVLVWLPASNRYFRTVKVARRLHRSQQL